MTRFIIDEGSLDLNGLNTANALEAIEGLLDCVEQAQVSGHGVCYDDELFHIPVLGERSFWELCEITSPVCLTPEIAQRAASLFSRMHRWDELEGEPPQAFEVVVSDGPVEISASITWAAQNSIGQGVSARACLCAKGRRPTSAVEIRFLNQVQKLWFASNEREIEHFFRWLLSEHADKVKHFVALAPHAFTKLEFVESCFRGIKTMSKSVRELAPTINNHLSALSDHGQRIFSCSWQNAPAEFGALHVDVSDENGNTKSNAVAKAEREIVFNGETIVCWWHSKLEPHRDRIHFSPDRVSVGGRIILGVFARHLTT